MASSPALSLAAQESGSHSLDVGFGARAACLAILIGSSSLASARTLQLYEGREVSGTAARATELSPGEWANTVGPDEHPIRLSLDGPNSSAFAPRRPIRTTLDAAAPELAPVPPPAPLEDGETPAPTDVPPKAFAAEVHFRARPLRLSLDQRERGAIGVPGIARPIRMQLDAAGPPPPASRPYRSVLE